MKNKTAKFGSSAIKRSMSPWAVSNSPEVKNAFSEGSSGTNEACPQLLPSKSISPIPQQGTAQAGSLRRMEKRRRKDRHEDRKK